MHAGDIIFVVGAVGLVGLYVGLSRWHRQRERRRVRAELAERGLEAVVAEIAEQRQRLELEEKDMRARASALASRNALSGVQQGLYSAMRDLDEYEALVRSVAAETTPL